MPHSQLIVNGDDFGLSEEVNEAIVRAFREGILTSCSLMASGDAFDHAVELARQNPGLGVGLHLVTVLDRSVLPHSEIPTIVDRDRRFPASPVRAGLLYILSEQARAELRAELDAQARRFQGTGLPCSHVDAHLHMHVHPVVFRIALELAERYGIRRMRLPRDSLARAFGFRRDKVLATVAMASLFQPLCASMERQLAARRIAYAGRVYGNLRTGRMSEDYLMTILEGLEEGSSEVYCHPALPLNGNGAHLDAIRRQQLRELEMLLSPAVIQRVRELGIRLSSYHELKNGEAS